MKSKRKSTPVTSYSTGLAGDAVLRTMALLTVVGLHTLSSIQRPIYTTATYNHWIIALDQLGRYCIPLFVALSGYGLSLKYQQKEFSWLEFLQRRVWKLIPAYLLWSFFLMIILSQVTIWQTNGPAIPLWQQLVFGRADYHLYFVPMIFQLYLVFPFFLNPVRRHPWLVLGVAAIFQIMLYGFFVERGDVFANERLFITDQQQYAWGFSWVFYFILGMCLPLIHIKLNKRAFLVVGIVVLTMISLGWTVTDAITKIEGGLDPIVALRFTRWPVLAFGTTSVILLTWLATKIQSVPMVVTSLAKRSYWLYLSHTLLLRIIFTVL